MSHRQHALLRPHLLRQLLELAIVARYNSRLCIYFGQLERCKLFEFDSFNWTLCFALVIHVHLASGKFILEQSNL